MTRIISGLARSLKLDVPKSGTRPTSDRVREAIFSALDSWGMAQDVRVLDLFAGSGALGLEAASRGASTVTLVEKHPPAASIIKNNAARLEKAFISSGATPPTLNVVRQTAQTYVADATDDSWDVVFVDPPYDFSSRTLRETLEGIHPMLSPDAVVMVERSTRDGEPLWPASLVCFREKRYGETTLWWAERSDREPSEE